MIQIWSHSETFGIVVVESERMLLSSPKIFTESLARSSHSVRLEPGFKEEKHPSSFDKGKERKGLALNVINFTYDLKWTMMIILTFLPPGPLLGHVGAVSPGQR